ncbi:MAG: hypothetical protein LQ342_004502 [Letrouitia transgressa]|nr:MAG: hypothetical protein LQ342_004502 [Letrouitia transgressa]
MVSQLSFVCVLSFIIAFAYCFPHPSPASPDACQSVGEAVSSLKDIPTSSAFCSEFLHVKSARATTTQTATSTIFAARTTQNANGVAVRNNQVAPSTVFVTSTVGTRTKTLTITVPRQVVLTIPEVLTIPTVLTEPVQAPDKVIVKTSTITSTAYPKVHAKRNGHVVRRNLDSLLGRRGNIPPRLQQFSNSTISAACACLDLPTPTSTTTVNVIRTVTAEPILKRKATPAVAKNALGPTVTVTIPYEATSTKTVFEDHPFTKTTISIVGTTYAIFSTTTLTFQKTKTTTSFKIATQTATVDACNPASAMHYNGADTSGDTFGNIFAEGTNSIQADGTFTAEACCRFCYHTANCMYAELVGQTCLYIVASNPGLPGISNTCPNGIGFAGTATGGKKGLMTSAKSLADINFVLGPCYAGKRA